jgi:hypothetical protein
MEMIGILILQVSIGQRKTTAGAGPAAGWVVLWC